MARWYRRLTAAHLKRVAEALEWPTTGAADQLRQLIEGKLESDKHVEAINVQVVIQEEPYVESNLTLMDESGVILTVEPVMLSKRESESEMEALQEALTEANQQNTELSNQLADTTQRLEEEKAETARLTDELAHVSVEPGSVLEAENRKLEGRITSGKGEI